MKIMAQKLSVLLLFLPLLAAIIPIYQPVSAADTAQWMPVNIPTEGVAGKWTLAAGSDIRCLTMANDGTLYCYANPSGTTSTFLNPQMPAAAGRQPVRSVMSLLISRFHLKTVAMSTTPQPPVSTNLQTPVVPLPLYRQIQAAPAAGPWPLLQLM